MKYKCTYYRTTMNNERKEFTTIIDANNEKDAEIALNTWMLERKMLLGCGVVSIKPDKNFDDAT